MTGHDDERKGKRFTLKHDVTRLISDLVISPASVFFFFDIPNLELAECT